MDTTLSTSPSSAARCTRDHAALRADPVAFAQLEQVGTQPTYDEPGQPDTLLLANCTCGSTLAREVFSVAVEPVSALSLLPQAAIRWCARDEYSKDGELVVDVIHYVTSDEGRTEARHSVVEATPDGRWWSLWAFEGDELDDASEDLLASDLSKDARSAKTSYRIDPLDMAIERAKFAVVRLASEGAERDSRTAQALSVLAAAGAL